MRIIQINYEEVFPGPTTYTTRRFGFTATIDEGDEVNEAFKNLRIMAKKANEESWE